MQDHETSVKSKIDHLRKALAEGKLAKDSTAGILTGEDDVLASSWGPAMRR